MQFDEQSFCQRGGGTTAIPGTPPLLVDMRKKDPPKLLVARRRLVTEPRQPLRRPPDIHYTRNVQIFHAPLRCLEQIGSKDIQHPFKRLVKFQLLASSRVCCMHLRISFAKDWNFIA